MITNKELNELYKRLTPENKEKAYNFYCKLLEQEQQEANKYIYYFDCLDGLIGDKYLTPPELKELLTGKPEPMTETEIINTARNYEATLYRYIKDNKGNYTNEVCLYDPFAI